MARHPSFLKSNPRTYGRLIGRIVDGTLKEGNAPHYEIWMKAGEADFRIAVNVQSVEGSEVLAYYDPAYTDLSNFGIASLAQSSPGFAQVATGPGGTGPDYLRGKLFPIDNMHTLPAEGGGISLQHLLDAQIERAKLDSNAVAIIFGEHFADAGADETFGFAPERGVHDIHMMQGNSGDFASDNRTHGDGALFIRFGQGETVALFIRFQSQSISTDDGGNPAD